MPERSDRMFVVGLVLLCAALVSYILRHPQPTPIEPALRQVEQSRRSTDSAVTVLTQARGETRGVSQREREAAARVRAQLKRTDDSLKALTEVLVDSAATMSDLRRSLSSAIQTADTLSDVVTHYVTMVDSLKSLCHRAPGGHGRHRAGRENHRPAGQRDTRLARARVSCPRAPLPQSHRNALGRRQCRPHRRTLDNPIIRRYCRATSYPRGGYAAPRTLVP